MNKKVHRALPNHSDFLPLPAVNWLCYPSLGQLFDVVPFLVSVHMLICVWAVHTDQYHVI